MRTDLSEIEVVVGRARGSGPLHVALGQELLVTLVAVHLPYESVFAAAALDGVLLACHLAHLRRLLVLLLSVLETVDLRDAAVLA